MDITLDSSGGGRKVGTGEDYDRKAVEDQPVNPPEQVYYVENDPSRPPTPQQEGVHHHEEGESTGLLGRTITGLPERY